jgi:cation diffusion facilitator family transporter
MAESSSEHVNEHSGVGGDRHADEHGHASESEPPERFHDHAGEDRPALATASQGHDAEHNHTGESHGHAYDHEHGPGRLAWLVEFLPFGHSHGAPATDGALESSDRGIRALRVSVAAILAAATFQLIIVLASGSTALLTDTLHNFSDAVTAIPLWVAFSLGRRRPTRRYTYGYGRAEDVAGLVIVAIIVASAGLAAYESVRRIIDPPNVDHIGWVVAAAIIGFLGNEIVALYRIRVGREIGSAALVADGYHARADGITSLAVLLGVAGVLLGAPIVDPIVGIVISAAILLVAKDATITIWHRLMDAVDPDVVGRIEQAAAIGQVAEVSGVRVRWLGHRLEAELHIMVDEDLPTVESHRLAEEVRHALFHAQPELAVIHVHVDPCGHSGDEAHDITSHHELAAASGGH